MQENIGNSKYLIKVLSKIIERHRKSTGKSMYEIAAQCGLSKSTWREAELAICSNITLTTLWKISDGLEIPLNEIIKELQENLGEDFILIDD